MQRKCLKCDHVHTTATGDELEACPQCGAIYSRVEAAMQARAAEQAAASHTKTTSGYAAAAALAAAERRQSSTVSSSMDIEPNVHAFAARLRSESLYPTFRNLVQVIYWLFVALAVIAAIGTLVMVFKGGGVGRLLGGLGGLFMTLLFLVMSKLGREMSLMLVDLSDAAVRIAANQEKQD